jgi:2-polyprenyl-3-methyl-5-hydroxy-6-metoxy-1,4-benzoquinol methylase
MDDSDAIIAAQRMYYDERAPDYLDPSKPSDRKVRGWFPEELGAALIDEFDPVGDVLELACGGGACTRDIVRHAASVTAVDGSPRMIERNREIVNSPKISYVLADVFTWKPDRAYDAVIFTFWLSHVPPSMFDDFWKLVRECLKPEGRVCFIDEDDRAAMKEEASEIDGVPVAKRTLADGRSFDIVKVFWNANELKRRLRASGWQIDVRGVGDSFLFGSGSPQAGAER